MNKKDKEASIWARVEVAEGARQRRLADEVETLARLAELTAPDLVEVGEPTGELPRPTEGP